LSIPEATINTIVDLVSERLNPRPVTSTWQYYERSEPTTSSVTSDPRLPPNSYGLEVKKSDLNDVDDLKKAIKKVPRQYQSKATKLLTEIENRSPELTFDSKGTIFVDGESLPESNFFIFFPLLYKKRVPKYTSFADFVSKLNSMNLNHLFEFKKKFNQKQKIDQNLRKDQKNWWLLT